MALPADPAAFLDDLSVRLYEEPLQARWEYRRRLPEVLRTVLLLVDLDTELHMNGFLGLVENSVGEFLPDMIAALELIGARRTADALRNAQDIMARHGIIHAALREDFADRQVYEVTNFRELHGEAAANMLRELESAVSPGLYPPAGDSDHPRKLLERYVAQHQSELVTLMADALRDEPN
ncbi:MAG TPA: DUF4375 domain-containing protein [Polyangiaceae bacterium]